MYIEVRGFLVCDLELDILGELCKVNQWEIGIVGDPDDPEGEMQGLVIGIPEFVIAVQQMLAESDEDFDKFGVQEDEEGESGLVELSKKKKMSGGENLH